MSITIGIRREDKNEWERRVPLTPADLSHLRDRHGLSFLVQPSPIRVFPDEAYRSAGFEVAEDLRPAGLVMAVKEIPTDLLEPGKVYLYFSHVIKGQPYNMGMLRRLLELGSTLIDYERIMDEEGRRLIFFGRHAGYAGMIETLWCLARRLEARGVASPFSRVKHAYEYESLEAAMEHLREIGAEVAASGPGDGLRPLTFGLAGYGNVSMGCQEILDCLGVPEVPVADLAARAARPAGGGPPLLRVVFKEQDMVEPLAPGASFELQDYYTHPEKYRGIFEGYLPHLDVLVNAVYWDERYPRLVTRDWARRNYGPGREPRLQVIGDISCDVEGGVELTLQVTHPDEPCFVYDPATDRASLDCEGTGPAVMAVDNLPCELPRESSESFGAALRDAVPHLATAEWGADFDALALPSYLKNAVIVHKGRLTPDYTYLEPFLNA